MSAQLFLLVTLFSLSLSVQGQEKIIVPVPQKVIDVYTHSRPWRAPSFSTQEQSLGWEPSTFETPKGMEENVKFWIGIFTKFTTDQGVLHDTDHVEFIFETLDFISIAESPLLSPYQKDYAKEKMIDNAKNRIYTILEKLDNTTIPFSLDEKERKIWDFYKSELNGKKFISLKTDSRIRFQLGQSDRMKQAIFLSGRYLEEMENIFKEKGLPIELTRLPFVESSFNVFARSKVGASGLWQVMKSTGKGKVKINNAVDFRNHPIEATKLAAKILKGNYLMLESWPLAITGYNHGPSGVRRITERNQSRNIAELIDIDESSRSFGFASRNFYASFLAVLNVEKNAISYFPEVKWSQPLESVDINLPKGIHWNKLLIWFENDDRKAQLFNPHINQLARKNRIEIPAGTLVSVPKEKYDEIVKEFQSKPQKKKS